MAKMKRMRQKLHNAAQKKSDNNQGNDQEMTDEGAMPPPPLPPSDPTALGARGDDLFKGVKIGSLDLLTQKLPDFDAKSTITSKTFKGKNLSKKDKRKLRREAWMAKIDHIQTSEKKAKETKKKEQTPIIGNIDPLMDALPMLELLMKKTSKQGNENHILTKVRSTQPERKRKKQMKKDISVFQKVSKHPLFKEDARRTITEHLKIAVEKNVI